MVYLTPVFRYSSFVCNDLTQTLINSMLYSLKYNTRMNSYADFSGFLENFKYFNKSNFFKANFEKFDQHYPSRGAGEVPFSYLLDLNK